MRAVSSHNLESRHTDKNENDVALDPRPPSHDIADSIATQSPTCRTSEHALPKVHTSPCSTECRGTTSGVHGTECQSRENGKDCWRKGLLTTLSQQQAIQTSSQQKTKSSRGQEKLSLNAHEESTFASWMISSMMAIPKKGQSKNHGTRSSPELVKESYVLHA